jgi:hypothetical protein
MSENIHTRYTVGAFYKPSLIGINGLTKAFVDGSGSIDASKIDTSAQFCSLDQQSQRIIQTLLDSTSKIDRSIEVSQQINEKLDALLQVARLVDVAPNAVERADREENGQAWNLLAVLCNPSSLFSGGQSSSNKQQASFG